MDWMEFGGSIWFDPSRENRGFGGFSFDAHSTLLYPIFFFFTAYLFNQCRKRINQNEDENENSEM